MTAVKVKGLLPFVKPSKTSSLRRKKTRDLIGEIAHEERRKFLSGNFSFVIDYVLRKLRPALRASVRELSALREIDLVRKQCSCLRYEK
jgi:hypothetical protein